MPGSESLLALAAQRKVARGKNLKHRSTLRSSHRDLFKVTFLIFIVVVTFALPAATAEKQGKGTQKTPSGPFSVLRMDLLTPAGDADLASFMKQTYLSLKNKLIHTLPQQVELGEKGVVCIRFNVQKDGTIADGYP